MISYREKPTPAARRGRLQMQVRRAFVAADHDTLSSSDIYDFEYARRRALGQNVAGRRQWSVYRLLITTCDRVGRARTIGRPWLWRLKKA